MDGLQLTGRSQMSLAGAQRRDIQSTAGDGFKAVFQNIIKAVPGQQTDVSQTSESKLLQKLDSSGLSSEQNFSEEILKKVTEKISPEKLEQLKELQPELKDTIDKLLNSAEKLSSKDVENLVTEVKKLLSNPETASQVLKVLESAGVDLSTMNMHDLQKALEALPTSVRDQLVTLLSSDSSSSLNTGNVSKAISEALGQLMMEQRKAKEAPATSQSKGDTETLDQFLSKSKARVVSAGNDANNGNQDLHKTLRQAFSEVNDKAQLPQETPETKTQNQIPQAKVDIPMPSESTVLTAEVKSVQKVLEAVSQVTQTKGRDDVSPISDADRANKMKKAMATLVASRSQQGTDSEKLNVLKRLMAQARMHLNNEGEGRFQIRLDPPELGNIRVTIENKDGLLSANITTENDAARQSLVGNLDQLKAALAEQGVTVGEVDVSTHSHDQESSGQQKELERQMQEYQAKMLVAADRRREQDDDEEILVEMPVEPTINVEV